MISRTRCYQLCATLLSLAFLGTACKSTDPSILPTTAQQTTAAAQSSTPSTRCFAEARLDQHLTILSAVHNVTIATLGDIGEERVSIFEVDPDVETTLNKIAKSKGWTWFRNDDGTYAIASEEWYRANTLGPCMSPTKVFRPEHIRASELESAIRAMLSPGIGRMSFDELTNKIIIVDNQESIAGIERFIREVDQSLAP